MPRCIPSSQICLPCVVSLCVPPVRSVASCARPLLPAGVVRAGQVQCDAYGAMELTGVLAHAAQHPHGACARRQLSQETSQTAENRVLRTSVCCHAMSSRLQTFSCFLVAVLAQNLGAQPMSRDAVIVSSRALKTAKIAFSWAPVIEAKTRKLLRKRSGAILDVFLCVSERSATGWKSQIGPENFLYDFKSSVLLDRAAAVRDGAQL